MKVTREDLRERAFEFVRYNYSARDTFNCALTVGARREQRKFLAKRAHRFLVGPLTILQAIYYAWQIARLVEAIVEWLLDSDYSTRTGYQLFKFPDETESNKIWEDVETVRSDSINAFKSLKG